MKNISDFFSPLNYLNIAIVLSQKACLFTGEGGGGNRQKVTDIVIWGNIRFSVCPGVN